MYFPKKIKFLSLFLLLISIFPHVSAASGSTTLFVSDSETLTIGTWNLLWPLDDYRINIYAIPSLEGSNLVSWYTNKDIISPGESLSLTVDLESNKHNFQIYFRVVGIKKSTGDTIFDKTIGTSLGSHDVPSSWSSPSFVLPVIPLEEFGIPAELSIMFSFSFSTQYMFSLSTYGLEPHSTMLKFIEGGSKIINFNKRSEVGSEVSITSTTVEAQGSITVSAGISVAGFPTPLKIDFATVPITNWIMSSSQDISLAVLKTPIEINFALSSSLVNLGESVIVNGDLTPPAERISVQLLIDGTVIDTTNSQEDGSFRFTWKPPLASTFSVAVKSLESKYTTASTSQSVQLIVNKPPEASFTFSPAEAKVGKDVQFTDSSTDLDGQITTWLWDFGDGSSSQNKNPVHVYSSGGTYIVRLTVTDNNGAKSTSQKKASVSKSSTSISLMLSESEVNSGDSISISGSINPSVSGASVLITFTKSDGSTLTRTILTDTKGDYTYSYTPMKTGSWNVETYWEGNSAYYGATSQIVKFTVIEPLTTQEQTTTREPATAKKEPATRETTEEEPSWFADIQSILSQIQSGLEYMRDIFGIQYQLLVIGILMGIIIALLFKHR